MEKKKFREDYPKLAEEIESGESLADVSFENDPTPERRFAGYTPSAVDFIRRCTTVPQAIEIIDYLEKRKELQKGEAVALRKQLKAEGLKSFGSKKKMGFYEAADRDEDAVDDEPEEKPSDDE